MIWSSLSFKQGIISKFFPPEFIKLSLPWIKISSKVSTQSDEKPGQIVRTFLTPSLGKLSKVYLDLNRTNRITDFPVLLNYMISTSEAYEELKPISETLLPLKEVLNERIAKINWYEGFYSCCWIGN